MFIFLASAFPHSQLLKSNSTLNMTTATSLRDHLSSMIKMHCFLIKQHNQDESEAVTKIELLALCAGIFGMSCCCRL